MSKYQIGIIVTWFVEDKKYHTIIDKKHVEKFIDLEAAINEEELMEIVERINKM